MWLTRAGSASTSISTIFPRLTVKPRTENGRPSESHEMAPAAPFTRAGCANQAARFWRWDSSTRRALLIARVMVMAIAKVHWPNGLWITNDGFQYPLLLLVFLLVLGYFGPGRYALDAALGIALPIQPVFWARLVGVLVVTVVGVLSCCLRHSVPLVLVF